MAGLDPAIHRRFSAGTSPIMLALVASIHAFSRRHAGVDGRDKHGHDGVGRAAQPKKCVNRRQRVKSARGTSSSNAVPKAQASLLRAQTCVSLVVLDFATFRSFISYMKRSGKFSVSLHALAHLGAAGGEPVTSESLSRCIETNPVVVRRTLGYLRAAGLVCSDRGHGGGWVLARKAEAISLGEIFGALGERVLFAIEAPEPRSECLIEQSVASSLEHVFADVGRQIRSFLDRISLADLMRDVEARHQRREEQRRIDERPI